MLGSVGVLVADWRAAGLVVDRPRGQVTGKRPVKTVASYGRFRENGREVGMTGGGWKRDADHAIAKPAES